MVGGAIWVDFLMTFQPGGEVGTRGKGGSRKHGSAETRKGILAWAFPLFLNASICFGPGILAAEGLGADCEGVLFDS